MGPVFAVAGVVLTTVLIWLSGYEAWVLIICGVAWTVALGVPALLGHRAFNTRALLPVTTSAER